MEKVVFFPVLMFFFLAVIFIEIYLKKTIKNTAILTMADVVYFNR